MRVESQELKVGSRGMTQVRCGDVENFQCYSVVMGMPFNMQRPSARPILAPQVSKVRVWWRTKPALPRKKSVYTCARGLNFTLVPHARSSVCNQKSRVGPCPVRAGSSCCIAKWEI